MKNYLSPLLRTIVLLSGAASMEAASSLWAMQAVVPPGTNDTQALETVVPAEVPVDNPGATPAVLVNAQVVPAGTMQGGGGGAAAGGGGAPPPVGPDGRLPGLPPGVPLGPGIPGGGRGGGPGAGTGSPGGRTGGAATVAPGRGGPSGGGVGSGQVGGAASAPGASLRGGACDVSLGVARTSLPHSGTEFSVPAVVRPAACAPTISFAPPWIRLLDAANFRFAADPNTSAVVREAVITVGNASYFVRQEPPTQPGLAAAPGHLIFGIGRKGKTDTKRVTAWSEHGAAITARAGHPWLILKARKPKQKRQAFDVSVRRDAGLGPGRHDTFVELTPAGPGASLRIPVVVEVPRAF